MSYTNFLQSVVVVPRVQHADKTIEEMVAENFTFKAPPVLTSASRSQRLDSFVRCW